MKKFLYSLMTLAAALTVASCQKEFTNSADPAFGGKPVKTTFNVDLGIATKAEAPVNSTLDDGTLVNKLYAAAFDASGNLLTGMPVTATVSNKKATVELVLSKGQSYDIVFFAMKDDAPYDVTFANNAVATFSYSGTVNANDPALDAFCKKISIASASTATEDVVLKRPFAQINVLSSNAPAEGQTKFNSTMTAKVPTSFDLFNDVAGTDLTELTFQANDIEAAAFGDYAKTHPYWLGMNFILVPEAGKVDLSFKEKEMTGTEPLALKNVAVKKNSRTNLVGAIYDLDVTLTYNIEVDPGFDSEGEGSITEPDSDTNITLANGSMPVQIVGRTPVLVGLNVNVTEENPTGDSFDVIEAGANGDVVGVKVESTGDSVGKKIVEAEIDKANTGVRITPYANGTADVIVTTPRYTKAGFASGTITISVVVSGIVKTDRELVFKYEEADETPVTECAVTFGADDNIFPRLFGKKTDDVTISLEDVDPAGCVTLDDEGRIQLAGAGSATVKATAPETDDYAAGEASYALTVNPAPISMKDVTITINTPGPVNLGIGETLTLDVAAVDSDGTDVKSFVRFRSSDTDVATVGAEVGNVSGAGVGEATITAYIEESTEHGLNAGSAEITVIVSDDGGAQTASTIADIKTAIGDATSSKTFDAPITLGAVTVTGVNGSQVYMEDETGGIILYLKDHGLERGKSYTGAVVTKGYIYKGAFEIEDFDISQAEVADATLPAETLAVSAVDFATYESRRIKLEGVTFSAEVNKAKQTVSVTQGSDAINLYVVPQASVAAASIADVYGIVTLYNNAAQVTVLDVNDIVVTGQGVQTATIVGMPSTLSLAPLESYDFASVTASSGAAVEITIESGIDWATMAYKEVTIQGAAPAGDKVIVKATAPATAGYTAAEATCTITIKDPSAGTQEYSVEFTYADNGGLSTTAGEQTGTKDGISVHLENGALNAKNEDIRIYKEKTMTISASEGNITKIVITTKSADVSANGPAKFGDGAPSGFSVSEDGTTGTWTGSSTSVAFMAKEAQVRMVSIAVTYEK